MYTCAILSNTTYYAISYFSSRDWTWNATKEELRMIKLIQNGKFVRKGQVINRYFWIVLRFDKLSVSSTVTNMSLLCALKWVFSNAHFIAILSVLRQKCKSSITIYIFWRKHIFVWILYKDILKSKHCHFRWANFNWRPLILK